MKRSRIKPANKARRAERLARDFGPQAILCRLLPCFACWAPPPSDPDHHPTRGAGGRDHNTAPLCRRCHDERGRIGVLTFQRKHLIDLELATRVLATIVRRAFRGRNGWERVPPGIVTDEAHVALAMLRGGGDL